jgi:DNA-directed RNA polymerase subunit RPC12/RpoP
MWQIEHQCPQCSAPVILEETERLFACPYCRVRLYITSESVLRFHLPPVRVDEQIAYVPYWRAKGVQFTCRGSGVTTGVIDRTFRAIQSSRLPYSLGVRPQVLKLRFVGRTARKALIQPSIDFRDTSDEIPDPSRLPEGLPAEDPVLFRAAAREVESLIFSPIAFRGDRLFDAIDGKSLGRLTDEVLPGPSPSDEALEEVSFIPTLCPNCGDDLIGEKESVLLFCSTCHTAWSVSGRALRNAGFAFLPGARDALYLPFWCMGVRFDGLGHRLFVDPAKTRRQDGLRLCLDDPGFFFWLPAFKINPSIFLRLAEKATLAQTGLDDAEPEVQKRLYPVTLPAHEAAKLVKVLVHLLVDRGEGVGPVFTSLHATPDQPRLCFVPFSWSGYELTQEKMRISVLQNALKYGKNL